MIWVYIIGGLILFVLASICVVLDGAASDYDHEDMQR